MVKVSFNSALAQKEAAKKEEENSQVLILPPDAKVRAAEDRAAGAGPAAGRRRALPSAPLGGEVLPRGGKRAVDDFILYMLFPSPAINRGRASRESCAAVCPAAPLGSRF